MKRKVEFPIPFYTQMVKDYKTEGFDNYNESVYWQSRGCGIASLRMIIDGFMIYSGQEKCEAYGTVLKKVLSLDGYCDRGWIHKKLIEFAKFYKIEGISNTKANVNDIIDCINKNRPCIVSVSVCFDQKRKGGHLIVVLGYVQENEKVTKLIVNHPSSKEQYNYIEYEVDVERFENSFSGLFMEFKLLEE